MRIPRYKTTNEFINDAKIVHGDEYDYSRVEYINMRTKVEIVCARHGSFWQTPAKHIDSKQRCSSCAGVKKLTTEEFIKRAIAIHGDRYDYSIVKYKTQSEKIKIICKIHGVFLQRPQDHLKLKQGCSSCYGNKKSSAEEFSLKASKIHNRKYDYSQVKYKNTDIKVRIICPDHGVFTQTPYHHLKGVGCPDCGGSKKLTTNEFIRDAKKIHGKKYDYSKVEYKNTEDKIIIICPIHGEFLQRPAHHKNNEGCPECASYINQLERLRKFKKLNIKLDGYLYLLSCSNKNEQFYKIGITSKNKLSARFPGNTMPYNYSVIFFEQMNIMEAFEIEQQTLMEAKNLGVRYFPEIEFGGQYECMKKNPLEFCRIVKNFISSRKKKTK